MTEIREIKLEEYEFLREMLYEAIYFADENQKPPKSIVYERQPSKYVDNFGRRGDFAFVLTIENELTGAVWARLFSKTDHNYGFVDEETPELITAIKETYRNQGFGTRLLAKLFEELKTSGIEKVSLSVDKRNRAVNLYRRFGFELISAEGAGYRMIKNFR